MVLGKIFLRIYCQQYEVHELIEPFYVRGNLTINNDTIPIWSHITGPTEGYINEYSGEYPYEYMFITVF